MQGVPIERDEREAIKAKITRLMSGGPQWDKDGRAILDDAGRQKNSIGVTFYAACVASGVSTPEAYRWRDEEPEFDAAVLAARKQAGQNAIDMAETLILSAIGEKDVKTGRWFLETRGKARGYSKRTELTGSNGAPLTPGATPPQFETEEEALLYFQEARSAPAPQE